MILYRPSLRIVFSLCILICIYSINRKHIICCKGFKKNVKTKIDYALYLVSRNRLQDIIFKDKSL